VARFFVAWNSPGRLAAARPIGWWRRPLSDPVEIPDLESDELVVPPPGADTAASTSPEPPAAEAAPAAEPAPSAPEATEPPSAETPDLDALWGKLSPEQKKALANKYDTDELFELNERLSGRLGTLSQKQARELLAQQAKSQQDAALREQRDEALRDRDPDKALEALQGQTAHEQKDAGDRAFQRASTTFEKLLSHPQLGPLVKPLAGKNYGEIAAKSGVAEHAIGMTAATLFDVDMAQVVHELPERLGEWEQAVKDGALKDPAYLATAVKDAAVRDAIVADPTIVAAVEAKLRPAIEKELRARFQLEDPPIDKGTGRAPDARSSDDFARDFAAGKTNDLAQAEKWLASLTDTPALAGR
jgi:hypothetical protein